MSGYTQKVPKPPAMSLSEFNHYDLEREGYYGTLWIRKDGREVHLLVSDVQVAILRGMGVEELC